MDAIKVVIDINGMEYGTVNLALPPNIMMSLCAVDIVMIMVRSGSGATFSGRKCDPEWDRNR